MIEKNYQFTDSSTKQVEKIIDDDPVMINHMILAMGDSLPEHFANSNVYMVVVRGTLSLQLNEQETPDYPNGNIVVIPFQTKMNVGNKHEDLLEFFVIKAPSPRKYGA